MYRWHDASDLITVMFVKNGIRCRVGPPYFSVCHHFLIPSAKYHTTDAVLLNLLLMHTTSSL